MTLSETLSSSLTRLNGLDDKDDMARRVCRRDDDDNGVIQAQADFRSDKKNTMTIGFKRRNSIVLSLTIASNETLLDAMSGGGGRWRESNF